MIDGACLSACTLVLGIVPRERICVTQRAMLGFHAAWMPGPAGPAGAERGRHPGAVGGLSPAPAALDQLARRPVVEDDLPAWPRARVHVSDLPLRSVPRADSLCAVERADQAREPHRGHRQISEAPRRRIDQAGQPGRRRHHDPRHGRDQCPAPSPPVPAAPRAPEIPSRRDAPPRMTPRAAIATAAGSQSADRTPSRPSAGSRPPRRSSAASAGPIASRAREREQHDLGQHADAPQHADGGSADAGGAPFQRREAVIERVAALRQARRRGDREERRIAPQLPRRRLRLVRPASATRRANRD